MIIVLSRRHPHLTPISAQPVLRLFRIIEPGSDQQRCPSQVGSIRVALVFFTLFSCGSVGASSIPDPLVRKRIRPSAYGAMRYSEMSIIGMGGAEHGQEPGLNAMLTCVLSRSR
jgi:hypothetical protein